MVHVEHTQKYFEQPKNIAATLTVIPSPIINTESSKEYHVDSILAHRKRGRGFQWLTLMAGMPRHDAQWRPAIDLIDYDGTITEALLHYILENNLALEQMLSRTATGGGVNSETNVHKKW